MKIIRILFMLLFCSIIIISANADAKITQLSELSIRILLDNSGSMYPGYRLVDNQGKSATGVQWFYEYPEFREWLQKVIFAQGRLNGKDVSLTVFNNRDLIEILPPTPREQITTQTLTDAFNKLGKYGQYTYLNANLDNFTNGFEGVTWMITDNIIETREGTHDNRDIINFFQSLNEKNKYRSVHLYKYPFEDVSQNQKSALAIYGILVSPEDVDDSVLEYFDRKFVKFKELFPGQGYRHLKLKDLRVNPLSLEGGIVVNKIKIKLLDSPANTFRVNQIVRLRLEGKIRSNLTQHTVISADYRIEVKGPFKPSPKAKKEYGVKAIPSSNFKVVKGKLTSAIPPLGTQKLTKIISSKIPLTLETQGFVAFIKSALGLNVKYTGKIKFSLNNVKVKLERTHLAGIYGIDQASHVFDFQDIDEIKAKPHSFKKSFSLMTGTGRGVLLFIILLLILAPIIFLVWFLLQKDKCRIKIDQNENTILFRRLGSHNIKHDGESIGSVRRGIGKDYTFTQNRGLANLDTEQLSSDTGAARLNVELKGKKFGLAIEPVKGGTVNMSSASSESTRRGSGRQRPGTKPSGTKKAGDFTPRTPKPSNKFRPPGP